MLELAPPTAPGVFAMPPARVTAETKVGRALDGDPALLDRLVAFHPAFRRLGNPILRRTMARIATFADAARVAGVPLAALLDVANGAPAAAAASPAVAAREPGAAEAPAPDWLDGGAAATFNARPLLASGRDPFAAIMAAVAALPAGAVLALDAPFDPAPLRRVLARKGFADYARALGPDHWRVWFRKPAAGAAAAQAPAGAAPAGAAPAGAARVWCEADGAHIDVRGLDPPAPMLAILGLLESANHDGVVTVHHEREPLFLYPELAERGWGHARIDGEAGEVRLRLTRDA
jgi:uncharacterized protein (DUF2249 family)